MTRTCRASGCTNSTSSRYSAYCSAHKARLRRHGAVDQEAVTKADLKPYLKLVRVRIEKNTDSPLWGRLEARWGALVEHARGVLAYYQRGHAGPRHERIAAQEIVKLSEAVAPREAVETALAMFMMQELERRRFRSDAAFRAQLARRVRGLTELNAGVYYDHLSGRPKRTYRELTPRAAALIAHWLAEAFGGAGIHLARREQTDQEKKISERLELHKALEELA
jgi:hypothetical protein